MSTLRTQQDDPLHTERSFDAFYRQEFRRVVNVVLALSGSRTAAEELSQEAFLKVHQAWRELSSHPNPEAWVRRVAINLAYSALRRRTAEAKVVLRLSSERPRVEELAEEPSETLDAIRTLPRQQAAAITLRYFDDMSIDQIAEVLEIEPATARVHLHRARSALATKLSVTDPDPQDIEDQP